MPSPTLSPARRAPGTDGHRDSREDLLHDQITPFRYATTDDLQPNAEISDEDEPIDPWEMADVKAHRKKTEVWSRTNKRAAHRRVMQQQDRPSLTQLQTDALLLRNAAIPNAVWTIGDGSHGQCGHSGLSTQESPHPAALELSTLRDGVRGLFAGPYCTIVVTNTGDALGFGTGPFRAAADPPPEPQPSSLAYEGAPPFRVPTSLSSAAASIADPHERATGHDIGASLPRGVADLSFRPFAPDMGNASTRSFERTEDAVHASIQERVSRMAAPTPLTGLLMPVDQVAAGDDFCVALMQNGLVFAWGDGEEGKLGKQSGLKRRGAAST